MQLEVDMFLSNMRTENLFVPSLGKTAGSTNQQCCASAGPGA